MNHLNDDYVKPNYKTATVFVDTPGDMNSETQRARVTALVQAFEAYPECLGTQFSHYWLRFPSRKSGFAHFRDYENFRTLSAEEDEALLEADEAEPAQGSAAITATPASPYAKSALEGFLKWPEFQHWNAFIKFDNQSRFLLLAWETGLRISRFFFTVSYHGESLRQFDNRKELLFRWRATVDLFPDLKPSVFDDDAPFVDQVEERGK